MVTQETNREYSVAVLEELGYRIGSRDIRQPWSAEIVAVQLARDAAAGNEFAKRMLSTEATEVIPDFLSESERRTLVDFLDDHPERLPAKDAPDSGLNIYQTPFLENEDSRYLLLLRRAADAMRRYQFRMSLQFPWFRQPTFLTRLPESWIIALRADSWTTAHLHHNCVINACYWLTEPPPGTGGQFIFGGHDGKFLKESDPPQPETPIEPRANSLLLFPAYAVHSVTPYGKPGQNLPPRISVAMGM